MLLPQENKWCTEGVVQDEKLERFLLQSRAMVGKCTCYLLYQRAKSQTVDWSYWRLLGCILWLCNHTTLAMFLFLLKDMVSPTRYFLWTNIAEKNYTLLQNKTTSQMNNVVNVVTVLLLLLL